MRLISVAVPTYMHAQYLPSCLDAIWFQDYPNLEIVVVNAASPDNTREVLDAYEKSVAEDTESFASNYNEETKEVERHVHERYPKEGRSLKIIHLEEDPGLSETYNVGVRESSGEYVTTIVSDDMAHPKMISRLAEALDEGYDFAYSDIHLVRDNNSIVREFRYPDYDFKRCLADWYLMGNSKLWRRALHDTCGWFDPKYPLTQDYELFLRFAMGGAKIVHVPEVLYSLRYHDHSRKTGNHSEEREPKIYTESIDIALRAREFLQAQKA